MEELVVLTVDEWEEELDESERAEWEEVQHLLVG